HILSMLFTLLVMSCNTSINRKTPTHSKVTSNAPIMGWASWNNYRVNINENIIKSQADAMISSGLNEIGYSYINVDDGFFGGRDEHGNLRFHKERFPNGMKKLAEYIHSKGL